MSDKVLSDEDGEKDNPIFSDDAIRSRTKCVSTRRVSKTDAGCTLGVFVPSNNPLFKFIGHQLSEGCCKGDCLGAFNCDKIYIPVSFKLVRDVKGQKSMENACIIYGWRIHFTCSQEGTKMCPCYIQLHVHLIIEQYVKCLISS